MKTARILGPALAVVLLLGGTALAQGTSQPAQPAQPSQPSQTVEPCKEPQRTAFDPKSRPPERIEGQVVSVDADRGHVSIRTSDGIKEFNASRETLQDMKVGDRIEAKLREAARC